MNKLSSLVSCSEEAYGMGKITWVDQSYCFAY